METVRSFTKQTKVQNAKVLTTDIWYLYASEAFPEEKYTSKSILFRVNKQDYINLFEIFWSLKMALLVPEIKICRQFFIQNLLLAKSWINDLRM